MGSEDETRPLLIRVNPTWSQRSKVTSTTRVADATSRSATNGNNRDDAAKTVLNQDTATDWKVKVAMASILASVVLERIVYYGLVGNLVMFLNLYPFKWKAYSAVCAMFLFFGVSYVMSLIGGWISDSFLGRFKTIVAAYCIYLCGYILMPFLAINADKGASNLTLPPICLTTDAAISSGTLFGESCSGLIVTTLILIAVSAGVIKANICPFGSDQLVRAKQQTQLSFFNWFYWCVNIGSFLGLGVIAYVEQQERFFYGFIACTVALGISAAIFIAGYPFYIIRPPDGSFLTNIFRIFREAWRNRRQRRTRLRNLNLPISRTHSDVEDTDQAAENKIPFIDYAKRQYGGIFQNSLVDDVKKLGLILAVFAVLIPYWIVYFQMQTTFMFQGLNMRLSFTHFNSNAVNVTNNNSPEIAVAWFTLCDAIFVILLLPLFDRIIYPRMSRAGYHFTFAKRIVVGMVFAAASMVAAGVVEQFRWKALNPDLNDTCFNTYIPQTIGSTTYNASDMSVLWQIPQYALIGVSEVFASVACLQFAVMVAPNSMKSAITGLFYFFCGIGSFLGSALVSVLIHFNMWFPNKQYNINCWFPCGTTSFNQLHECHFDYYFFFLAGCEGLGLVLFIVVASVYKLNFDELTFYARLKSEATSKGSGHVQNNISRTTSTVSS